MKLSKLLIGATLIAFAGTVPAQAWQVAQRDRGFVVGHEDDDIRFGLVCSPERPEGLGVLVRDLSVSPVNSITMLMTQPGGRVAQYSADVREESDGITGTVPASTQFLEDFRNGIRFQLVINNVLYMDTNMDGTGAARDAMNTACGI